MHEKTAFNFRRPAHNDIAEAVRIKNFSAYAGQKRSGGRRKRDGKDEKDMPSGGAVAAACAGCAGGACAGPRAPRELVPVGQTVGIEASTEGLLVVSLSEVETAEGKVSPAADGGIQPGDIIVRLGNCEVSSSEDFAQAAACLDGSPVAVQLMRGGQLIQYTVTPALSAEDNCWRLGLWLRDGIAGIGTVTFYDRRPAFSARWATASMTRTPACCCLLARALSPTRRFPTC